MHVQRNRRLSTQPVKTSPTQHMSKYTAASTDGHSHRDLALCTVHTSYCLWILDSTDASHLRIKIKGFFTVFCLLLTLIFKVYLIVDVRWQKNKRRVSVTAVLVWGTLTLPQGLLDEVVLGLKLCDQVPSFQKLFQFLQQTNAFRVKLWHMFKITTKMFPKIHLRIFAPRAEVRGNFKPMARCQ